MKEIRVTVPYHLQNLAKISPEIIVKVEGLVTVNSILTQIESDYPNLRGTIRDHGTLKRRPFLRFFACGKDITLESFDTELPDPIINGQEQFKIIGAIAGG